MSDGSNTIQDYSQSRSIANPIICHHGILASLLLHQGSSISEEQQLAFHEERKDDADLTNSIQGQNTQRNRLFGIVSEIKRGGCVTSLSFSPDGRIAIGAEDNKVIIYDSASGDDVGEISRDCPISAVIFSPNGEQIAVGTGNKAIIYDSKTGAIVNEIQRDDLVRAVIFSPDSSKVCVGGWDKKVIIFNVLSGTVLREIHHYCTIIALEISPDNSQILVGGDGLNAIIYDIMTGAILREIERCNSITALAFFPDGSKVAICDGIGGKNGCIAIYDVGTGAILNEIKRDTIYSIAFSPSGGRIAVGGVGEESEVIIYDAVCGSILKEIHRDGPVLAISYSPDGACIAVGGVDEKVIIYDDIGSSTILHDFVQDCTVWAIAFSPDSSLFALASGKNTVIYRYNGTSAVVLNILEHVGYSIAFSLDSSKLLIGGDENKVIIFDVKSASIDKEIECGDSINVIALSGDGRQIAIGSDKALLCDAITGAMIHEFESDGSVTTITFSPTNNYVACGYENNTIIYDRVTGSIVKQIESKELVTTIGFSANGEHIAIGSIIYDITSAAIIKTIDYNNHVSTIAYSSDGKYIGIGGSEKKLNIYNTTNWEPFCSPILFHESIESICFLANGGKNSLDSNAYILAIAFGNYATIMRVHRHTKTPVDILIKCETDQVLNHIKPYIAEAALWRNTNDKTLLSVAAKEDRYDLLFSLLTHCIDHFLIPNSFIDKTNGILTYLEGRQCLQALHVIFKATFYCASSSALQLGEMAMVVNKLAVKKDVSSVMKALNAGGENAIPGFVLHHDVYLIDPEGGGRLGIWYFLNIYPKINTYSTQLFNTLLSKASPSPIDLTIWRNDAADPNKCVHYKVMRVLLPGLGSFESLKMLIKMQTFEPFDTPSLCAVINVQWLGWARKKFLFQFFIFMVWLVCLTWLCVINKEEENIKMLSEEFIFSIIVFVGVLYFVYVIFLQRSACYKKSYWMDGWNVRHAIGLLLASISVILEFAETPHAIVAHVHAVTLLINWAGLLFYVRVFESNAWVVHALLRVGREVIPCLRVWFILVLMFAFSFRTLYDTTGAENICMSDNQTNPLDCVSPRFVSVDRALVTILLAMIGVEFDSSMAEEAFSKSVALILMIMMLISTSVIFLYFLIAFIGHEFDKVADNRNAIQAREKARIVLQMYYQMSPSERERIERNNRWTYVIIPIATLDLINTERVTIAIGKQSAATKDNLSNMTVELKAMFLKEINNIKTMKEIKADLEDGINKKFTALKNELQSGLSNTTELNKAIILQLGTIEEMLTNKVDESILSSEGDESGVSCENSILQKGAIKVTFSNESTISSKTDESSLSNKGNKSTISSENDELNLCNKDNEAFYDCA